MDLTADAASDAVNGPDKPVVTDPCLDPEVLVDLLKRHDIFASMEDVHLRKIAGACPVDRVAGDTVLFRQGESGSFAYLLISGELSVDVETDHGQVTVAVLKAPDMVGEISVFARKPRNATVSALSEATLLRLERDIIREILAEHTDAVMTVIGALGGRLQGLNSTIATLIQAAEALVTNDFRPAMLETLKTKSGHFRQFAHVFDNMAHEITEKSAQREEMRMAAKIQGAFLPSGLEPGPAAGMFDIFASMTPAKEIGGDFYDYFMVGERELGFAIGDVCGKGMPAAMFMSVSRMILKTLAREGLSPGAVLTRLNAVLADDNPECMFVTLFYGCLDLDTGELAYSSAGHEDVYHVPSDAPCRRIESLGPIAGVFEGTEFPSRSLTLEAGDSFVLVTDGITEALDIAGNLFGARRLEQHLDTARPASAADQVDALTGAVADYAQGAAQSDDITCVAVRYLGSA